MPPQDGSHLPTHVKQFTKYSSKQKQNKSLARAMIDNQLNKYTNGQSMAVVFG